MFNMYYEWDEEKNILNKIVHNGVSFEEAQTVWGDPLTQEYNDPDHSNELETRYIAIGYSRKSRVLLVVFTERNENLIRIISARKATKKEEQKFLSSNGL